MVILDMQMETSHDATPEESIRQDLTTVLSPRFRAHAALYTVLYTGLTHIASVAVDSSRASTTNRLNAPGPCPYVLVLLLIERLTGPKI